MAQYSLYFFVMVILLGMLYLKYMKIYSITVGQLVVLWLLGIIAWMYALDGFSKTAFWLIPGVLIFYTVGWFDYQNKQKK